MTKKLNIAFAGGGSGGHVMPISSLITYIYKHQKYSDNINNIFWFGQKNQMEEKEFDKLNKLVENNTLKLQFMPILSGKLRRKPNFKEIMLNVVDIFKFAIGMLQSFYFIYKNQIDVIFCKGGYVALPVVLAAKMLRRKIIVHESDTKPGLVNYIAAKFADKVFIAFDNVLPRAQNIGQIINDDIIPYKSNKILEKGQKITVLVNLGSLGSASVHDSLIYIFKKYSDLVYYCDWHIILGSLNLSYSTKYYQYANINTYNFVDQKTMGELLLICDLSICRGGTTTLAEQKLFGLKQLIIPIPRTHDQSKNAEFYKSEYQDIYITQDKNLSDNIYQNIIGLQNFRKTPPNVNNIKTQIQTAKRIICDELIL